MMVMKVVKIEDLLMLILVTIAINDCLVSETVRIRFSCHQRHKSHSV